MGGSTAINLAGRLFGRLTVVSRAGYVKRNVTWLCRCTCGTETVVPGNKLRTGHTSSCGCLSREKSLERFVVHGQSKTRLFRIWAGMKTRCFNERSVGWLHYGGRGITVCESWRDSFEAFSQWAYAAGYSDALTIDRINNDGPYSPENCRWATMAEQRLNTSRGRLPDGRSVSAVAEQNSLSINTVRKRIRSGWDALAACTTPPLRERRG